MSDATLVAVHPDAETARTVTALLEARLPEQSVTGVTTAFDAETEAALAGGDVLVTFELPDSHYAAADPSWVHAMTAGVDDYPRERLAADGVVLTNAAGVNAEPVAEQVLAYMLTFARRLHRGIRQQVRGEWDWYGGRELADSTVCLVGVGSIGSRVAALCQAVGMTILGVKRDPDDAPASVDEVVGPNRLHDVLPRADYVVLACPLTDETRGLVGESELRAMRDHAVVVNVARGEVVDQDALVAALDRDEVGGAALDVFTPEPLPSSSPLWDRDDVVVTPHMAGSTPAYWERNADLVAENFAHFRDGNVDRMRNRVLP